MISKNLRHVEGEYVSLTDKSKGLFVVLTNNQSDTIELTDDEVVDLQKVVDQFLGTPVADAVLIPVGKVV